MVRNQPTSSGTSPRYDREDEEMALHVSPRQLSNRLLTSSKETEQKVKRKMRSVQRRRKLILFVLCCVAFLVGVAYVAYAFGDYSADDDASTLSTKTRSLAWALLFRSKSFLTESSIHYTDDRTHFNPLDALRLPEPRENVGRYASTIPSFLVDGDDEDGASVLAFNVDVITALALNPLQSVFVVLHRVPYEPLNDFKDAFASDANRLGAMKAFAAVQERYNVRADELKAFGVLNALIATVHSIPGAEFITLDEYALPSVEGDDRNDVCARLVFVHAHVKRVLLYCPMEVHNRPSGAEKERDRARSSHDDVFAFLRSRAPYSTLVRDASYEFFEWSSLNYLRALLLIHSSRIVQDDTGIPFTTQYTSRFDVVAYGTYATLNGSPERPKRVTQKKLAAFEALSPDLPIVSFQRDPKRVVDLRESTGGDNNVMLVATKKRASIPHDDKD